MGKQEINNKGFFNENEGIFLISSNYQEKQQIEDGLNREINLIQTVYDLISAFTDLTSVDGIRASVIITDELPVEISKNLDDVRDSLETSKVPVFEIGTGEIVRGAKRFGTIEDFIRFARVNKRKERINNVSDKEQRGILEELQLETEVQRIKIEELEDKIEQLQEEKKKLEGKYTTLKTEVDTVYIVQRDTALQNEQDLKDKIDELTRLYNIEKDKSELYRTEKDDVLGELNELRISNKTLEGVLEDKQIELRKLEGKIKTLENEIKKITKEKDEILLSKVDAEEIVILNDKLKESREEILSLKEQLKDYEIKYNKVTVEKELRENELKRLQEGKIEIENLGRTMRLAKYEFERVELIYIKVFEWLPYLRLALNLFFDKISEKVDGRTHMMILRHDDGMDNEYFKGIPLWSKLKDVPASDRVFRLYPGPTMFERLDDWEKRVKLLVVVDNIKNNEYYLSTKAREKIMTVVRRESDISKYNLKGSPITIEGNTVYGVGLDEELVTAQYRRTKDMLLDDKVQRWVDSIYE